MMKKIISACAFFILLLVVAMTFGFAHASPPSDVLRPNSDISEKCNMSPYPGDSGILYDKINEVTADDFLRNIFGYKGQSAMFGLPDLSGDGYSITGVTVCVRARLYGNTFQIILGSDDNSELQASSGNIVGWSGDVGNLDDWYHYYSYTWSKNPFTGLDWTIDNVNHLQAGVTEIEGDSYWLRGPSGHGFFTQLYVTVDEVPSSAVPEYAFGALLAIAACFSALFLIKRPRLQLRLKQSKRLDLILER